MNVLISYFSVVVTWQLFCITINVTVCLCVKVVSMEANKSFEYSQKKTFPFVYLTAVHTANESIRITFVPNETNKNLHFHSVLSTIML